MQQTHQAYEELTARVMTEASRRGWSMRRARTEVRLLMAEAKCDSATAVEMLEQGKLSRVSQEEEARERVTAAFTGKNL